MHNVVSRQYNTVKKYSKPLYTDSITLSTDTAQRCRQQALHNAANRHSKTLLTDTARRQHSSIQTQPEAAESRRTDDDFTQIIVEFERCRETRATRCRSVVPSQRQNAGPFPVEIGDPGRVTSLCDVLLRLLNSAV